MGILIFFFLILTFLSFAEERYYCIQVASSRDFQNLKEIFFNINTDDLPEVRVEKVGKYYTIRVGFWRTKEEANKYLKEIKRKFPEAFVRTCYYIRERIVLKKEEQYKLSDFPFNFKKQTIKISGQSENEKICKAVLYIFKNFKNIFYDEKSDEKRYKEIISFESIFPYSVADAVNRVIILYRIEGFIPTFCRVKKENGKYNLLLEGFFVKKENKVSIIAVDFGSVRESNGDIILDIIRLNE